MVVETKFDFFDKCNLRQKMNEWGHTGIIIVPMVNLGGLLGVWRNGGARNEEFGELQHSSSQVQELGGE